MMKKVEPGPEQESVWDYPRPPALEPTYRHLKVEYEGVVIAETEQAVRVLETSQPPAYYFPPQDINMEYLSEVSKVTFCEWKGQAHYYDVSANGKTAENAAWYYPDPTDRFEEIKNYVAFYPTELECYADSEKVEPNEGGFYGGWITSDVVGPFKGGPGTAGW